MYFHFFMQVKVTKMSNKKKQNKKRKKERLRLIRSSNDRYGYWGICFLYGTLFVLGGLVAAGKTYNNSEAVRKAVQFYISTQNEEGGWGECLESCPSMVISIFVTSFVFFNTRTLTSKE